MSFKRQTHQGLLLLWNLLNLRIVLEGFNVREVEGNQLHFQWLLQGYSDTKLHFIWLVVSTHLKNICQIGSFPQVGVKIKNIWNHHLDYYLDILSVTYTSMINKLHLRQSYPAIPPISNENLPTDPLPWAWGMNLKRHLEVSLAEKPHGLQHTWNHLNKSVAGQQLNYCSCRCQPQPILPILS